MMRVLLARESGKIRSSRSGVAARFRPFLSLQWLLTPAAAAAMLGEHRPPEELPMRLRRRHAAASAPRVSPPPARRRRRRLLAAAAAFVVLALGGWWAAGAVDRDGLGFHATGREVVETVGAFARAVEAGDADAAAAWLDDGYRGRALGLGRGALHDEKDGVRVERFAAAAGAEQALDAEAALAEWLAYRRSFAALDSLDLHLHRLDAWEDGGAAARLRFEAIGTPHGETAAGIDRGLLEARLVRGADGRLRLASLALLEGERTIAAAPHFVDVAPALGVDFENRYYPAFLDRPLAFGMLRYGPAGITAADVDGDGLLDLFVPDGVESRLYRNAGEGGFVDVTAAAGLAGLSGVSVALFADWDDDGDRDLFVSRTFEPNQIFENRGPGPHGTVAFADVTAGSGLGADCCTTVASFADVDDDGDLDLYVGRYLDPREAIPTTFYARNGEPNQLYRNDGGHRFTNVTRQAGVGETGLCLGTVFGDYDDDGDADLYVVNDFGRKTLYRNRGPNADGSVTFDDVTVETGTLAYGAGMSASFGDYDNDGRLDLYVAHIRSEHAWFAEAPTVRRYMLNTMRQGVWRSDMPLYLEILRQSGFDFVEVFQQMASGNTLLRNRGDGSFEDTTEAAGANPPGWFWGSSFADFDNDGWQDVYSANGWVYGEADTEIELEFLDTVVSDMPTYKTGVLFDPEHFAGRSWHGHERNRHLRNEGDGTFREIGRAAGSDLLLNSRGIAVADFWNRGVLDIAVAASTDRHALLANTLDSGRRWLTVEAVGAGRALADGSNRDGVGARVTLTAGGVTQTREIVLGDGYGSQNDLRAHFGLGDATTVDELVVRWPRSGRVQRFRNLAVDRFLRVIEGRDEPIEMAPGGAPSIPPLGPPLLAERPPAPPPSARTGG
jgi:enediyne biosynthesis protein E4